MTRGRRRRPDAEARILAATLEVVGEGGYAALTVDEVVRRSGVGKSAVYSRCRDRADLATMAIASMHTDLPEVTGSLRTDLVAYLSAVERDLGSVWIGVIGSLLGHGPEVLELHRERAIFARARHSRRLLQDTAERATYAATPTSTQRWSFLIGAIFARALTGRGGPHRIDASVDTLLAGISA